MSNKIQLQTNNTTLDTLITRVNAAKDIAASLPEAGSAGGSIEICTVSINDYNMTTGADIIYTGFDDNGNTQTIVTTNFSPSITLTIASGSCFYYNRTYLGEDIHGASCQNCGIQYIDSDYVVFSINTGASSASITIYAGSS